MQKNIDTILNYLNEVKTRCTYGAVSDVLGIPSRAVGKALGEKCARASWVVNNTSHEPTGYSDDEKHPELYRTKRVIKSAEVLRRNLDLD